MLPTEISSWVSNLVTLSLSLAYTQEKARIKQTLRHKLFIVLAINAYSTQLHFMLLPKKKNLFSYIPRFTFDQFTRNQFCL